MKNINIKEETVIVGCILLVVLIAFGVYYYNHVSKQEDFLNTRDIHFLTSIGDQIHSRVEGVAGAISSNRSDRIIKNKNDSVSYKKANDSLISTLKGLIPSMLDGQITNASRSSTEVDSFAFVSFYSTSEGVFLSIHYIYKTSQSKRLWKEAHIQLNDLGRILATSKKEDIFSDIIFVRLDAPLVVQDPKSTYHILRLDTLQDESGQSCSFQQKAQGDGVNFLTLVGEHYRLYIHPLQTGTLLSSSTNKIEQWALCGLVPSASFRQESMAISYDTMIFLFSFTILLMLALPLLKLKFMKPEDRVTTLDVVSTTFSLMLGAAFVTFLMLHTLTEWNIRRDLDNQLLKFADDINTHFHNELHNISSDLRTYITTNENSQKRGTENIPITEVNGIFTHHPFFNQIFYADNTGMQRYKARIDTITPALVSVKDRSYFKDARDSKWLIMDKDSLTLQPLFSKTTGEFSVTLTHPKNGEIYPSIDFRPLSLTVPILPESFGFCIIDCDGKTLFHSVSERNLQENFSAETNVATFISAITKAHLDEWITMNYMGKEHRAYIRPLERTPWSIITFYSTDHVRIIGLQIVSASLLFFLVFLLPLVLFFLIYFFLPGHRAGWIWPDLTRTNAYKTLLALYTLFLAMMIAVLCSVSTPETLCVMACFLPHVVLLFTFLELNSSFDLPRLLPVLRKNKLLFESTLYAVDILIMLFLMYAVKIELSLEIAAILCGCFVLIGGFLLLKHLYPQHLHHLWSMYAFIRRKSTVFIFTVCLLFLVGIILPSVTFFKIAYETQLRLYVRQNQLNMQYSIENRKRRIEEDWRNISNLIEPRMRRTEDTYLSFFYNTYVVQEQAFTGKDVDSLGWIDSLLIRHFMPSYNQLSIGLWSMASDPEDYSFSWLSRRTSWDTISSILACRYPLTSIDTLKSEQHIFSSFPSFMKTMLCWNAPQALLILLSILGCFILFYYLLAFCIREVFFIDVDSGKPQTPRRTTFKHLWSVQSPKEQYVLFRLVKDRFINYQNKKVVQKFFDKGLLVRKPDIRVYDESFEAFISQKTKEPVWSTSQQVNAKSTGTTFLKTGMFLLILLLILFLFGTQHELWSSTLTFVSAAAALIPSLFKLLGAFDSSKHSDTK